MRSKKKTLRMMKWVRYISRAITLLLLLFLIFFLLLLLLFILLLMLIFLSFFLLLLLFFLILLLLLLLLLPVHCFPFPFRFSLFPPGKRDQHLQFPAGTPSARMMPEPSFFFVTLIRPSIPPGASSFGLS